MKRVHYIYVLRFDLVRIRMNGPNDSLAFIVETVLTRSFLSIEIVSTAYKEIERANLMILRQTGYNRS